MSDAFNTFVAWYANYGYVVLFLGVLLENLGVPVPGEASVLVAGFLASPEGGASLHLGWVMPLAFMAAVTGDNLGYWVGRRLARPRIQRHQGFLLLTPERFQKIEGYFARFGTWTVSLGRFLAGVRVVCALSAGTAGMPWFRFVLADAVGALLWAVTMSLLGYFFGRSWQALEHVLGWGSWLIVGGLLIALLIHHFMRRAPR